MTMVISKHDAIKLFLIFCTIWWVFGAAIYLLFGEIVIFQLINGTHNAILDFVAWYGTQVGEMPIMVATLIVTILWIPRLRNYKFVLIATIALIIPALSIQIFKNIIGAPRPLTVFGSESWIHYLPYYENSFWNSIPSGHTSGAFSFALLLASILNKSYKNWAILFFAIALFCGWTRIYLAQHFFIDVLLGSMIGTIFTLLILRFLSSFFKYPL